MSVAIKTYRNVFGSIDNEGNLLPNNNVLYGPYESIDEAYDTIYNALGDDIPIGLTIGIKVDDKITEYWFNEGINKQNLVAKNKTSSNENIDIEDIKTDINKNKNNITLLDKSIEALSSSTQKIIDGRTIVAKAKEATSAEKDSEGNVLKTTYAKQEDYNYTLGTALDTSELGKYLNIRHNYNKTLAIPYATENNGGAMSPKDKKAIVENKNAIAELSTKVENFVDGHDEEMQAINDKFDGIDKNVGIAVQQLQGQINDNAIAIEGKQDALVSGENIKTINGQSIIGYGNITNLATKEDLEQAISNAITNTLNTLV